MDVLLSIIQSVGFPIAVCIFLAWYIKTQNTEYREDIKEITGKYDAAIEKFSASIDKNTEILTRLAEKME